MLSPLTAPDSSGRLPQPSGVLPQIARGSRDRWGRTLLLALMALLLCAVGAIAEVPQADLFVAPDGSDTAPGTAAQPLATLSKARDKVRALIYQGGKGGKRAVTVLVRGGTYTLDEPLVFGAKDSGTDQVSVTYAAYPGEVPVLSGGRRIGGWKAGQGGLWTTSIAQVKTGKWNFRRLVVNGQAAVRARTPNIDEADAAQRCWRLTEGFGAQGPRLVLPPGLLKPWRDLDQVEIVLLTDWDIIRRLLQSVDPAKGVALFREPQLALHPYLMPKAGMGCYFENSIEMLDRPGEWYLDRKSGVLTYSPRPGEDLAHAEVVAPVLTRLLAIAGAPGTPVRNLHFRGLRFAHADWPLPEGGFGGIQAGYYGINQGFVQHAAHILSVRAIDAAIAWEFAVDCSLEAGAVAHVGGAAVHVGKGCRNCRIDGNEISDVGSNGVRVGDYDADRYGKGNGYEAPAAELAVGNRISNNRIHDCGHDYLGAVGVWSGIAKDTVIAHNEIYDLPYSGVSVGFVWSTEPSGTSGTIVEANHIHDVMKMLSDGGGIYALGFQPGSVMRGNHIHQVQRGPFALGAPNNGIFLDQGTKGFTIEGNVIHDTTGGPFRYNGTQADNRVGDNFLDPSSPQAKTVMDQAGPQAP